MLHGTLERVRRCATQKGRAQQGLFVIEGERVVRRALTAGVQLEQVLVAEGFLEAPHNGALAQALAQHGVAVERVTSSVLRELADGRNSGLCIALAKVPPTPSLQAWLQSRVASEPVCLLVLVNVREPGNVGALMRTALASAVDALVTLGETDPFHPKAVRSSLGSVFKVRHFAATNSAELSALLRAQGVQQVAAVAVGGEPLRTARLSPSLALYVGNEAQGLPEELIATVDERVTIPMPSGVDSFSVNAATAIVLYEIAQRRYERGP
ncbi:MAG TPA: RNA methyltransferase [Polyangiaceae bacterium]|nr:RNA methyltransferase [Polyangiaceae bacterium]